MTYRRWVGEGQMPPAWLADLTPLELLVLSEQPTEDMPAPIDSADGWAAHLARLADERARWEG